MHRPFVVFGLVVLILSVNAAEGPGAEQDRPPAGASNDAAAAAEDRPLKQLLLETLREIKALEDQRPDQAGVDLSTLGSQQVDERFVASALQAIGTAQAALGDKDAARETWGRAVDVASTIKALDAKAEVLIDIATAQEESGDRGPAGASVQQAAQAVRLIKENDPETIVLRPIGVTPLETKCVLLARIAELQARLDDKPSAERSRRQAREAVEATDGHLDKVRTLVQIARREDAAAAGSAWDRILEIALAPRETFLKMLGVEIVLRERIRAGALEDAVRIADEGLKGEVRAQALWIAADEMAIASKHGREVPGAVVDRLAKAIGKTEIGRSSVKDKVFARLAILQARCGSADAANKTLDSLESDDPVRRVRLQSSRLAVLCVEARGQLKAGSRRDGRATLRKAQDLLSESMTDSQVFKDVAELLAEVGDRDAASQAALVSPSRETQAIAMANAAAALARANDRAGAREFLEASRRLADQIPEESLWDRTSREDPLYNDPSDRTGYFGMGFVRKDAALRAIAIAHARAGDIPAAHRSAEAIIADPVLSDFPQRREYADTLRAIATIQVDAGDFAGAWNTCSSIPVNGYSMDEERNSLVASVARNQAAAGDARGAMRSALGQPNPEAKLFALKGLAEGIVRRKASRQAQ